MFSDASHRVLIEIDFAAHAAALGAISEHVDSLETLEQAVGRALKSDRTHVIIIDTDPMSSTAAGGAWWDVVVPEVSERKEVREARSQYEKARKT